MLQVLAPWIKHNHAIGSNGLTQPLEEKISMGKVQVHRFDQSGIEHETSDLVSTEKPVVVLSGSIS